MNNPTYEGDFHEITIIAGQLLSEYFMKDIKFNKIIQLSEPNRRNLILRLVIDNPLPKIPQSLILKKTLIEKHVFKNGEEESESERLSRFAHDWAGLELLTQIGGNHAPTFYVGSIKHEFIIIEDLGLTHPSLVDPLTRISTEQNVKTATTALGAYMDRLAKIQVATIGYSEKFNSILMKVYPAAIRFNKIYEIDTTEIVKQFEILIGADSQRFDHEIQDIVKFTQQPGDFNVLLHGDICPDNVYYQGNNVQFIDFEFGDYGHALIDGVYLRMCMPSCWCSKAVPEQILEQMEVIYRTELIAGILACADDYIFKKHLTYACAYWMLRTVKQIQTIDLMSQEWLCPSGPVAYDSEWNPNTNEFRPRILSRLAAFIKIATETGHFPNLCTATITLLQYLIASWPDTKYIDNFPVFKENKTAKIL